MKMTREQILEDALNHLLNAVAANAAPDLLAAARAEAERAIRSRREEENPLFQAVACIMFDPTTGTWT